MHTCKLLDRSDDFCRKMGAPTLVEALKNLRNFYKAGGPSSIHASCQTTRMWQQQQSWTWLQGVERLKSNSYDGQANLVNSIQRLETQLGSMTLLSRSAIETSVRSVLAYLSRPKRCIQGLRRCKLASIKALACCQLMICQLGSYMGLPDLSEPANFHSILLVEKKKPPSPVHCSHVVATAQS